MTSLFFITGFFSTAQGITVLDSIVSGGVYRKFRIYIPPIYSGTIAAPLVMDLHGFTSNAVQQQFYSNFKPIADTAGFITIYPEGTVSFGGPFWNAGITNIPNDVQFVNDLMTYCQFAYNIDDKRIYSCGMSNGGIMSYYLACNAPNRIAAIASVTGTMFNNWFGCAPSRAIPVMEIHGTGDDTVPYAGDSNFAPIDSIVKKWVKHNNCNPVPLIIPVPDINASDNSFSINYRYTGGRNGSSVELYKVFGGSHSWPGAFPVFANTNQDFSASVEIWRFFRQYKLNQFIDNVGLAESQKNGQVKIYPNPASTKIYLQPLEGASYLVFDLSGKQLTNELFLETLDISEFQTGIYFLHLKKNNVLSVLKFIKE